MRWLEQIPWTALILAAVLLGIVPFGQSHLVEKVRMLFAGTLRRPLDWFDLFMHGAPILLLLAKAVITLRGTMAR